MEYVFTVVQLKIWLDLPVKNARGSARKYAGEVLLEGLPWVLIQEGLIQEELIQQELFQKELIQEEVTQKELKFKKN